jgi:outer membrane receptor for ferric coprogen and ferric-rhodotorulic acid
VILVGGLRWFKPYLSSLNRVTNVLTEDFVKKHRVHRYGLVVKLLPTVSAYYTDAQNLFTASQGRTDLVIQGDGLGEAYRDSEGKLKELGLKFDYKVSERITAYGSVAVFKMEQTNIRTFGTLPSGNQGLIQSAKDSSDGWEADLGMRIKTATGAADLIFTVFNGDSAIAADQGRAYVRQANAFAPWKYSIFGRYTWSSGTLRGLRLGGGFEDEDSKRNGAHLVDRPLTSDAFIGYPITKAWDAQLNLSNITDETYIIQVAATGLVQRDDGFRAKLTLTYKW